MNPDFTEMLMTNILLVYYAKLYLGTAQHSLISTEHSLLQRKAIHAIFTILHNIQFEEREIIKQLGFNLCSTLVLWWV